MFNKIKHVNLRIKIIVLILFILVSFSFIAINIIENNVNKKVLEMANTYLNNMEYIFDNSLDSFISGSNYDSNRYLMEGMIDKIALVSVNIFDTKGNLNHICFGRKIFNRNNDNSLYKDDVLNELISSV
jgi:xanthine/uracil/vitamin C permease (AzgA family)